VVRRGGIRFGVEPCRATRGDGRCTLPASTDAHLPGGHDTGDGERWPVADDEWARWAGRERSDALLARAVERHPCALPDPDAAWGAALTDYQDGREKVEPADVEFVCPDCLQHWDLVEDACGECGRHDGARWVRRFEWAGDEPSLWSLGLFSAEEAAAREGYVVTAAGGWCAPTETRYDP